MKSLVVFDSNYGNTQKVAEVIAQELGARALKITEVKKNDLKEVELLLIGSPINGWRPTAKTLEFVKTLNLKNQKAAAFDTRMDVWYKGDAVKKIAKGLIEAGALVVGSEVFYVLDKEGPLREGELEKAKVWAKTLK